MKMTTIYFVRHSIRDVSVHNSVTAPLTPKGRELARQLADFFVDKDITAIHCSPYQRAVDTLLPTARSLQLDIRLHDNLRERNIGMWMDDFATFAEKQWRNLDYSLQGGESLQEVAVRMIDAVDRIARNSSGNVIIGGHATAFSILFQYVFEVDGYSMFQTMSMPDVFCARWDGYRLTSLTHVRIPSLTA
ncbi:histidine phosphatase family protein [Aerococcaceae bacterium NML190938]|nr:histidine phosphatase family protein [Aerococcaceae bacterium NML190938]